MLNFFLRRAWCRAPMAILSDFQAACGLGGWAALQNKWGVELGVARAGGSLAGSYLCYLPL